MTRVRSIFSTVIMALGLITATYAQEAELKERVLKRSQAVVDLLSSGAVKEGTDGLLKAASPLESAQSQLMREENQDRQAIFQLIADRSNVPVEQVQSMYAKRAQAKFPPLPPTPPVVGACKLVPAKTPDALRLVQYLKQGMNYASQKKFDMALAEFQAAQTIDKNFLGLNQNIGSAQMGLKKYSEAEAAFKAEITLVDCLSGLSPSQLVNFGYFFEVNEKDPSRRRAAQAEKLRSELPKAGAAAHYNLACVYSQQRQTQEAVSHLRAAVDAGFSNKRALNSDPDLSLARQTPEFREILARVK